MLKIPEGNVIAFDTETTGLNWRKGDRPYCFSFCNENGETAVASFSVDPKTREVEFYDVEGVRTTLQKFFFDPTITKVAHNAQFDVGHTEAALGIKIRGKIICTMNLIRLVRSDAPLALKPFCEKYLGIGAEDEEDLKEATRQARRKGKAKGYRLYYGSKGEDGTLAPDYWLAPRVLVERYAVTDAARCMAVYKTLYPEVRDNGLKTLWKSEVKTWKVLRAIEKRGIRIFPEKIEKYKRNLKKKLRTFEHQAHQTTGQKINLNSSIQLRKVLYEKLKELPRFLTKTGLPSTDVDSLKGMNHPLAKTILNIRACHKTIEFMDQYLHYMVKNGNGCYYIHPNFKQAGTASGRESCSSPNLQQVASGRNDKGIEVLVEARSVFGPSPGYQLRSYDWKNIEVFIPAFVSREPVLMDVLKAGGDVHQNASDYLTNFIGKPIGRDIAKRIFFGLLYGIGAKKLSKLLQLEEDLASQIVVGFRKQYPTLWDWMNEIKSRAFIEGKIVTAYGRIRYLSSEEAYIAPNAYVQGTAADILKSAKVKIHDMIKERHWDVHIVLPIHDEVLIEVPKSNYGYADIDEEIVFCMQDNPELKMPVPIPVSISAIGKNWADKQKVAV